jgi:hypothetical protein
VGGQVTRVLITRGRLAHTRTTWGPPGVEAEPVSGPPDRGDVVDSVSSASSAARPCPCSARRRRRRARQSGQRSARQLMLRLLIRDRGRLGCRAVAGQLDGGCPELACVVGGSTIRTWPATAMLGAYRAARMRARCTAAVGGRARGRASGRCRSCPSVTRSARRRRRR